MDHSCQKIGIRPLLRSVTRYYMFTPGKMPDIVQFHLGHEREKIRKCPSQDGIRNILYNLPHAHSYR